MAKKSSPAFNVRVSIEYPWTFRLPRPSSVPPNAALISSNVKFMEQFFGDRSIIEWMNRRSDCLICLMPLTGNEDGIPFLCLGQCEPDRGAPVDFDSVVRPLHSLFDFLNDCHRIFTARVVRSDDGEIAFPAGCLSHQRSLCPIALSAAAKHNDQSARGDLPGGLQNLFKRIVRVCVVHYDAKRLAGADGLESSWNMMEFFDAMTNGFCRYAESN